MEKMFRSTLNTDARGSYLRQSVQSISHSGTFSARRPTSLYTTSSAARTRERIRVYGSRLYAHEDLELLAEKARAFVRQGFTAIKQRFGYGPQDGIQGMRNNLTLVKTVRDAVGTGYRIGRRCLHGLGCNLRHPDDTHD